MKKDSKNNLKLKLNPAKKFVLGHLFMITVIVFFLIYLMMIVKIGKLATVSPTESQVNNTLNAIPQPSINKNLLIKIQQLQNQNIKVKSLFDKARNNPFSE